MIRIRETVQSDLETIERWKQLDDIHKDDPECIPEYLLTGRGLLCFCLTDDIGPLCFVRLDKDEDLVRLATQFGPKQETSKRRLVMAMLKVGIPSVILFAKNKHFKGVVFKSNRPKLIKFMTGQGFIPQPDNDYILRFNG
jgi:hypothetical protein